MITKTIDGLFTGTRYGVWALGVLGIVGSVILAVANLSLGLPSAMTFIGALFLSIAVALALMPKWFVKGEFLEKRFVVAAITVILAIIIIGIIYLTNGGFPELNLLFI